ncbi:MAG: BatC protein, partial [Comamonadaceae bacterium]
MPSSGIAAGGAWEPVAGGALSALSIGAAISAGGSASGIGIDARADVCAQGHADADADAGSGATRRDGGADGQRGQRAP